MATKTMARIGILLTGILVGNAAEALRCGTRVISRGDSKPLVWEKCGEPQFREVIRDGSRYSDYVHEERWYYRKRTGRLRPVVIFDNNGRVRDIRSEK